MQLKPPKQAKMEGEDDEEERMEVVDEQDNGMHLSNNVKKKSPPPPPPPTLLSYSSSSSSSSSSNPSMLQFQTVLVNGKPVWLLDDRCLRKDIDHCLTCGSYALRQEFFKPHYCVDACYKSSPQWMEEQQQLNAPIKLFKQPALPSEPNPFKRGQMLEAIDPDNQSLFCVVTIEAVEGWRILLNFDGFDHQFDFWVNSDSLDIFPPGWCSEQGHTLQPPGDFNKQSNNSSGGEGNKEFNWHSYLVRRGCDPAPRHCFQITKETDCIDDDIIGTKLEAVDIRASSLMICVATVTKTMGHRFLVHFDSWDNIYDYWADLSSPFVYAVGHCEKNKIALTPPNGYDDFTWGKYLQETKTRPMPSNLFQPLPPVGFKRGMRIECVDVRNQRLIRPAVIQSVDGHMLTIRYEGWPEIYDVKMNELSDNLHPVGYCETTHHSLERVPKPGPGKGPCPNLCGGKGNSAFSHIPTHETKDECPYTQQDKTAIETRGERVVILVDGSRPTSTIVLPGSAVPPPSVSIPTSIKPPSMSLQDYKQPKQHEKFLSFSPPSASNASDAHKNAVKKLRKEDIFSKMMSLAQTVLKEERTEAYLFERQLGDLDEKTVCTWNVTQTHDFIASLPNCKRLANTLKEQLVDGDALLLLTKEDFKSSSEGNMHWIKLYYVVNVIKASKRK